MRQHKSDVALNAVRTLIGNRRDWRLVRPQIPSLPRLGAHWVGPAIAVGSVLVGWFAFKDAISDENEGGVAFALFIGAVSIMLMTWSNLLSTRASVLETLFGGLDRMYRWHRWFGVLSVGAMWLHIQTADDVKGIRGASRGIADSAEDLAETGSTLLYILVAISLLRWLPTRWWRLSHKLLVVPYAFASWHFYTSTKPYANNSPWGWWFTGFMIIGLAAWVYRVVWRDMVRRGHLHRVAGIQHIDNTITVDLQPIDQPMRYKLGQFAFLKIRLPGLQEPHPFTIASSPDETVLRFVIRDLGDWTMHLAERLKVGDRVTVEGPYGSLQPLPAHPASEVLWVAGGVGITPFLGAACSRTPGDGPTPHLFYCIRSRNDAPGLTELEHAAAEGRITLHVHASSENNRLQRDHIEHAFGNKSLRESHVVMCGPDSLIRAMRPVVRSLGSRHIHVEAFDIRTGVGPDLSRHIDQLLRRLTPRTFTFKKK